MAQELKEASVGFLVLLVVASLLVFPYHRLAAGTAGETVLSATFNRIDGLNVGDPVRLGGIRVGVVDDVVLDSRFRAVVTIRMDSGVPLPADTSAAIHTDGLFGSKFLVLEPGGDDKILGPGDSIGFTQDAMIVSNLLDLIIGQGRARLAKEKACGCDGPEGGAR
jgi:phospholipid/cholesterol/gamma-HCH transport system substrate-binding protein